MSGKGVIRLFSLNTAVVFWKTRFSSHHSVCVLELVGYLFTDTYTDSSANHNALLVIDH